MQQTRTAGALLAPYSAKYLDLNYDRTFNDQGMKICEDDRAFKLLRGTSITDLGLGISGLTKLTELDLAETGINDIGLSSLAG